MIKLLPFLISLLFLLVSCKPPESDSASLRLISLAPNITETIYALGLESQLVGVSTFCDYPEPAKLKEKLGGLYDTNVEKVYALNPTVVIHLPSQKQIAKRLNQLGIKTLSLSNKSTADIDHSIVEIGKACGVSAKSVELITKLKSELPKQMKHKSLRGLIVVSRSTQTSVISTLYAAGKGSWYEEILNYCGAENCYQGELPYPQLGCEGVIELNPDFIIEIMTHSRNKDYTVLDQRRDWSTLFPNYCPKLFMISEVYAVRPGPRYPQLFQKINKIIKQVESERR